MSSCRLINARAHKRRIFKEGVGGWEGETEEKLAVAEARLSSFLFGTLDRKVRRVSRMGRNELYKAWPRRDGIVGRGGWISIQTKEACKTNSLLCGGAASAKLDIFCRLKREESDAEQTAMSTDLSPAWPACYRPSEAQNCLYVYILLPFYSSLPLAVRQGILPLSV